MTNDRTQKPERNAPCPCGSGRKFRYCHGKNFPPFENISSISVARTTRRTIIVTKDALVNQLFRDGPKIAHSFDKLASEDIREISAVFSDALSLMFPHVDLEGTDYNATCASLLSSALSTFVASIEVARHGHRRPYGAIARGIAEVLSTVLHIAMEPDALSQFHDGKLKSTKSISVATRAFPPFGLLYGMLSNHFVHINKAHATFEPTIKYVERDDPFNFIISTMRAHAWLIYVITELAFHEGVEERRYWKSLAPNELHYAPSEEERTWQRKFLQVDVGQL
jgi:SEC-C motif-containing protein